MDVFCDDLLNFQNTHLQTIVSKHQKSKEGKMEVKCTMITAAGVTTTNDSPAPGSN